jgi:DNA-binding NtrC family response regulator
VSLARVLVTLCGSSWSSAIQELVGAGIEVVEARSLSDHKQLVMTGGWNLVLLGCFADATAIKNTCRNLPCGFILLATVGSEELALAALRAGASDYLRLPCQPGELLAAVRHHLGNRHRPAEARMAGTSTAITALRSQIQRVARTDVSVLLTGETGTGKELAASMLHESSPRSRAPFVAVNCAAIPDALLESELFGHEKGAFTGAHQAREGKLEFANGGTVFLDEIGDMNPYAQAKILRAIECRRVQRLGGNNDTALDVRLIAATHRDLEKLVACGEFRSDLYYRLNVARLRVPPLRERQEDIPLLFRELLAESAVRCRRTPPRVAEESEQCLRHYDWPGNVRELRNAAEWALIFCDGDEIRPADLPAHLAEIRQPPAVQGRSEKDEILFALNTADWNKSAAAKRLHCSRMTLYRKLEKYGIA